MRRDLALVSALAIAALVVALLPVATWLSAALLLPLVLFLPGYALAAGFFAPRTVGRIERAIYAVALSIAVVAVGGLLIQLVLGLSRDPWVVFLVMVTLGAALWAHRKHPVEPLVWPAGISPALPVAILAFALAGVIAGLAIASAGSGLREAQAKIHFADFWLVPVGAGSLASGEETLEVGLRSHEGRPVQFGLQLSREGQILLGRSVSLRAGETWKRTFAVTEAPRGVPVIATLTREGKSYRRLDLVPSR
jgi:uncharacterized membrane protein